MNQKARKFIYLLLVVTLLSQSVFMPDYVLAQEEIAIPPGAARIIENGERFMDSAPIAIGRALQLAEDLKQISQADLETLPVEELIAARQEALEVAQQTAVAQGSLGGILTGADELDISGQTAVDLDALISDLGTDGFSEELETVLLDSGLTITDVANLETGAANNFTLRRDVAQSGFDTETLSLLQSLGLSTIDIEAVEEAYANYGIANTTHSNKLAQLGGTQAEFTFVRDSALVAYIQLLSQQVYQAQLLGETGRPIATADIDILVQDQLRLLTHIGYLNALWGSETRPEVGEGQWLFIERYSWQVAERLNTLILETHNLGLAVDLFIALQIHTTAITAQSGDPSSAKAELEKLAAIEAALVGDNLPGGQAALEATPSLFWRVVLTIYDYTSDEAVLAWVNEEELPVAQSAVTVAKDQAYGRMARLAKPVHFPALSGSIDESDETNNTDIALFYTSRAALPDNILSLLEGFIPNFEDVLDFVWGVISGQSDNPLAIGINIVLSFVPVLGEVLDLIALFTEPTVWGKAMALIGLAASIASDGSELLSFLGIGIPAAITTEVADIAASILKNVTRFVSNSAASVIARIPFDQALRRGVEVIEFIGRRIIEGGGDLITRIGNVLTNSRDAFSALLTRFGNNLEALYRIGLRDGGYLVGRLLHLSDDAAAYSDELLETVARVGDEVAGAGAELSDEAVDGLDELASRLPSNKTDEILNSFCPVGAARTNGAAYVSSYTLKDHVGKPTAQTPVNCREIVEEIFGSLDNWSDDALDGLQRLADNGNWTGIDIAELLSDYRLGNLGEAAQRGFESALATLHRANIGDWAPDRQALESMASFIGRQNNQTAYFSNYTEQFLNSLFETGVDQHFNEQFRRMMVRLNDESNDALRRMVAPDVLPPQYVEVIRPGVIETLRKAEHPNTPWPAKHGYDYQLRRGEHYLENEGLIAFEFDDYVEVDGAVDGTQFSYDLVLDRTGDGIRDAIAEVKYWRASTLQGNQQALVRQVTNYATTNQHVIIEFGETVDNPITRGALEGLRETLITSGLNESQFTLHLVARDGTVTVITGN